MTVSIWSQELYAWLAIWSQIPPEQDMVFSTAQWTCSNHLDDMVLISRFGMVCLQCFTEAELEYHHARQDVLNIKKLTYLSSCTKQICQAGQTQLIHLLNTR